MRDNYQKELCDSAMISRFLDGELDRKTSEKYRTHLGRCPRCRQALEAQQIISECFQSATSAQKSSVDFQFLEKNILQQLKTRPIKWEKKLLELISLRRFYIPAAVLAAGLILFFSFFYQVSTLSEPSAFITSITGNVSSIMIFETPKTHQTILWFNEELPLNEKNHAL